jgi:hypothetical protein
MHLVVVVSFAAYSYGVGGSLDVVVTNFTVNGVNQGAVSSGSTDVSYRAVTWNPSYRLQLFSPVVIGPQSYIWGGTIFLLAIYDKVWIRKMGISSRRKQLKELYSNTTHSSLYLNYPYTYLCFTVSQLIILTVGVVHSGYFAKL